MKPGELYWSLVEPIWDTVSIYDGPDIFLEQFQKAPAVPRTLFAAHWCQSEVRNGGFHQFFSNSTGVLAPEAIEAFLEIGMPQLALVVEKAARWFEPNYPREREFRNEKLDSFENENPEECDPFKELDDQFYRLIDAECGGFDEAADRYASKHHS